ncbi:MAG: CBS domain-containing protein [Clostridia bacterium]|nr:CBS domain-containing protein [Clostridia bacterium]
MKVKDICSCSALTISSEESVTDAARKMANHNVGALPVVDYSGHAIGMITDRDITIRSVAHSKDPDRCTVGDIMTDHISCICPDDDITSATKKMSQAKVRRLPVINDGQVVGFLSLGDIASIGKYDMEAGKTLCDISCHCASKSAPGESC